MWHRHRWVPVCVCLLLLAALRGAPASHAADQISFYQIPGGNRPTSITMGPDGALWFTEYWGGKIGRITTSGQITEYALPPGENSEPNDIVAGPDGALWFTIMGGPGPHHVGRITTGGKITLFKVSDDSVSPYSIVAGPDGALWFSVFSGNTIGRITTSGELHQFALPNPNGPMDIVAGPDGALWFTHSGDIARITTSGEYTRYELPHPSTTAMALTTGPDGMIWFSQWNHENTASIGRISMSGEISMFPPLTSDIIPTSMTTGPDGAVWYNNYNAGKIGWMAADGSFGEVAVPIGSFNRGIVAGSDQSIWFADTAGDRIGVLRQAQRNGARPSYTPGPSATFRPTQSPTPYNDPGFPTLTTHSATPLTIEPTLVMAESPTPTRTGTAPRAESPTPTPSATRPELQALRAQLVELAVRGLRFAVGQLR